jgi:8-oxo-dGTP pyrophosphatase MutT (NUDIX family)
MSKVIASGLFIVRKDNKVLICHPTNHKEDFFSIPKGKVEDDETFLEGAFRETYEETNLDLSKSNDFTIYPMQSVNYSHKKKILYPFLCLEKGDSNFDWDNQVLKCNSNVPQDRGGFPEMDGYQWVTLDESRTVLHDTQVACIDKILEIIEKCK